MLSLSAENNFHKTILQYFFKCYTYKIKIYENNNYVFRSLCFFDIGKLPVGGGIL